VPDFQGEEAWGAFELTDLVRQKQPSAIMNNRLFRRPEAGWTGTAKVGSQAALDPKYGDFMTPEQQVPDTGAAGVDWETCMTMNTTWGYSKFDHDWKSAKKLIETLIEVVSKGGNFLLNIGPQADGTIPPESVERLQQVGRWLDVNGEAIYGASASPIPKPDWGRITYKPREKRVYLHVLEWPADGRLIVAGLPGQATAARVLGTDHDLALAQENDSIVVTLPDADRTSLPTVVRLQLASPTAPVEKDKSLHSDGSPWRLHQAKVEDPTRPRVLLIGDSILNGYRHYVVESLDSDAYVDAWVNPYYQSDAVNKALAKVLDAAPYDIVHFNIGLHGYQEGRIKPEEFKPLTRAYVDVLKSKLPKAKLIWASSTPVTVKGKPLELNPEINPTIVEHNRLAAEVMEEKGVTVSDFYGLLVDKRELARGDSFHWNGPAYKLLGDSAAQSIRDALSDSGASK
jgi:hypothetical protein